jgi:hypothetical protein
MKSLESKFYPDLLRIFEEENKVKDGRYPDEPDKDSWPRHRFNEANLQFGEWGEYELSHAELLKVRLHWNRDFGIPEEGMTVVDAIQPKSVREWIAEGKAKDLPDDSHIWLVVSPLIGGPIEHQRLKGYEGHLVVLDGIHRIVAWASVGKEPVLAFIAGNSEITGK